MGSPTAIVPGTINFGILGVEACIFFSILARTKTKDVQSIGENAQ